MRFPGIHTTPIPSPSRFINGRYSLNLTEGDLPFQLFLITGQTQRSAILDLSLMFKKIVSSIKQFLLIFWFLLDIVSRKKFLGHFPLESLDYWWQLRWLPVGLGISRQLVDPLS